ncbi:MAG: AIPR family protein [Ekhidna sp.]|nr:AIPR family protein [Ekhidna sp.]
MEDTFREQIKEDIELLQKKLSWDPHIKKDEYTFNYWVLSNLYNLDEEACSSNITEYNDKGIDCYVHYEEDKELYIVQNKYYDTNTKLSSKELSDFLTRPLSKLNEGSYNKSRDLQDIYTKVKKDEDYKIFLHFYVTNDLTNSDLESVIKDHDQNKAFAELFFLKAIEEKYFGKSYKDHPKLNTNLNIKNKGSYLAIRPKEYELPHMSEAYYVMAKVSDVFQLWKDAEDRQYPLFEENIREYLGGTSGINKGIITTLKDPKERNNFFYYNNGITIICNKAKANSKSIEIYNPQIVNGCQTVSSIAEVLKNEEDYKESYSDVYVMVKILVLENKNTNFYRDIVKYTNSQNSINEKIFGATLQPFFTVKKKLLNYGILLRVKQSDRFQFKERYSDQKLSGELRNVANNNSQELYNFERLTELQIELETLLQIIGALFRDAYFAYQKKKYLLKPTSKEYYQSFSCKINELLTTESMSKLVFLYKRAEKDQKDSEDKKTPSPYYLINFIGHYLREIGLNARIFFDKVTSDDLNFVYNNFKMLSKKYIDSHDKKEYNVIINEKIDKKLMDHTLNTHIQALQEYNKKEYDKLKEIFEKMKI